MLIGIGKNFEGKSYALCPIFSEDIEGKEKHSLQMGLNPIL